MARQLVLGTEVALIMADPLMHYAWPGGRQQRWGWWWGGMNRATGMVVVVVVVGAGGVEASRAAQTQTDASGSLFRLRCMSAERCLHPYG